VALCSLLAILRDATDADELIITIVTRGEASGCGPRSSFAEEWAG
jgi:hypothetical protein